MIRDVCRTISLPTSRLTMIPGSGSRCYCPCSQRGPSGILSKSQQLCWCLHRDNTSWRSKSSNYIAIDRALFNIVSLPFPQVQSHQLGSVLRSEYFHPASPSFIHGVNTSLIDTHQVRVLVKAGGEGPVVFDSAIATLQGLFPPTPNNRMMLANDTTIVAPLGGYQYVPGLCHVIPHQPRPQLS